MAKNEKTHRWLQDQFKSRKVIKTYLALVDGHPPTPTGRIEVGIQRDPHDRKKMAVAYGKNGRVAISSIEPSARIKTTHCLKCVFIPAEHIKSGSIWLI